MVPVNPRRIPGRWRDGYALDLHTIHSEFLGHDEYGHAQFDTTRSEVGELLYRLKYRSDDTVVSSLVDTVEAFLQVWKPPVDMIVPVTPTRHRVVQPVLVLGDAIARRLELPFVTDAVKRVREVPELKDVHDYNERMRLLEGAHEVNPDRVRGHKILLLDDLYRSGATMNEITASLYDRGHATEVYALAISCTRGK